MTALTFDTLMFAKRLIEAGVPKKQAEVQAEAMKEIVEDKIATKQDLDGLKLTLALKMAEQKSELIKWMLGTSAAQAAIIISCLKLVKC